ncbi:MAG TPA: family 43 glycosylhydrolase [Sphingomonas sp.]
MRRGATLLLAPLLLLIGTGAGPAQGDDPFARAIFTGADPAALVEGTQVWLYPTNQGAQLDAWVSSDLTGWTRAATLIRRRDIVWLPNGARENQLWAPHMAAANGRYYLYFSVGPQEPRPARIGVATCDTPQGPCVDSGRALLDGADSHQVAARPSSACRDGVAPTGSGRFHFEAIDPMVFLDPKSGRRLLYAGGSNGATLRVFELGPDMVSIAREVPVDQPPCFTEGAWMHERRGLYYLSYSSGNYDRSNYSVRYAVSLSPTGPWRYGGAILVGSGAIKGPGHHAFFRDPRNGAPLIAYHRWEGQLGDGPYRDKRKVALARVTYRDDGAIQPIVIAR